MSSIITNGVIVTQPSQGGGSGGSAQQVYANNGVPSAPPTDPSKPALYTDTSIIPLRIGYVWNTSTATWNVIPQVTLDGNGTNIVRGNSTASIAPTTTEVPNPVLNDTANIKLLNNNIEYWHYNGSVWVLDFTILALQTKRLIQNLFVGNNVVTHGMNLPSPFYVNVTVRDSLGQIITAKKIPFTETANTVTINVGVIIASAEIDFIQIKP
jgi:hypothetical protein